MIRQVAQPVMLAAAVVFAAGCGDKPTRTAGRPGTITRDLPSLADVRTNESRPHTQGVIDTPADRPRRLITRKLVYDRRETRIDFVLSALKEPEQIPQTLRDLWRRNGLRIGQVPYDRLELLQANLPESRSAHNLTIVPSPYYGPIKLVGRVDQQQLVRYIDEENRPSDRAFLGGQFRFLAKLVAPLRPGDPPKLDLLPHHYGPRETIQIRPYEQRLLDGTTFDELRLYHTIPPDTAWIIWCDLPAPPTDDTGEPVIPIKPIDTDLPLDDDPAPRPVAPVSPTGAAEEVVPPTLGETMLTGRLRSRPVRIVVFITAVSAPAAPAAPAGEQVSGNREQADPPAP